MNDNKFSLGLMIGLVLGGGAVFLFGTKKGRNLMKIVSERGMDGLVELLEEYDLGDLVEMEEYEESSDLSEDLIEPQDKKEVRSEGSQNEKPSSTKASEGLRAPSPKKRFFRRVRK